MKGKAFGPEGFERSTPVHSMFLSRFMRFDEQEGTKRTLQST
jgi:hypothetical protein